MDPVSLLFAYGGGSLLCGVVVVAVLIKFMGVLRSVATFYVAVTLVGAFNYALWWLWTMLLSNRAELMLMTLQYSRSMFGAITDVMSRHVNEGSAP
jgi:multisubunit Na+/H+ antiporter MnhE subunit